jgi:dienelactone hydrolase
VSTTVLGNVVEHAFRARRDGDEIPAVVWQPAGTRASPPVLVLLGHGGSGHKRSARVLGTARWLAENAGLAAVAIDGPFHGERAHEPFTVADYQARVAAEGADGVLERMVDDWRATIEVVDELGLAGTDVLGYHGLSMGARYGLPLVAALGDRIRCAVFGKYGLRHSELLPSELDTVEATRVAAGAVTARTLFHVQWHDELFPRDGQLELFDLLACHDKRLIAYPGAHADAHPEAVAAWRAFLADGLLST